MTAERCCCVLSAICFADRLRIAFSHWFLHWLGLGATMMLPTSGRAALFDLTLCGYQANSAALFALYLLVRASRRPPCELEHALGKLPRRGGGRAKNSASLAPGCPCASFVKNLRPILFAKACEAESILTRMIMRRGKQKGGRRARPDFSVAAVNALRYAQRPPQAKRERRS